MIHNRKLAIFLVVGFAFCVAAVSARAQGTPPTKPVKAHFEVVHMLYNSIQVRSVANLRELHTFIYSDKIRADMQKLFDQGGYQYGDKVTIWYRPGEEIALKIRGKRSKPH